MQAELNLVHSPPERVLAIIGFKDVFAAADAVPEILKFEPIAVEGIDDMLVDFITRKHLHPEDLKMLPEGCGWLVVEFGADTADEAAERAQKAVDEFKGRGNDALCHARHGAAEEDLGACARPRSPPPPTCRTGRRPIRAGRTARFRARTSATTCATSRSCCTTMATMPRSTAISAMGWCIAVSISISPPKRA